MKIFAVYKGDTFITEGTTEEIAKTLGVKRETIDFMKTPTYKRRHKGKNHLEIIKMEEDETIIHDIIDEYERIGG